MAETRLWFVTDLHGSDICFRKFLNAVRTPKRPDVLIVGGDITGKMVVPLIEERKDVYKVVIGKKSLHLSADQCQGFERLLADRGAYGFRCDEEELKKYSFNDAYRASVVRDLHLARLKDWMSLADARMKGSSRRVFINPANDDPYYVDELIDRSVSVRRPEGKVVTLDDTLTMISCGYSNRTPYHTPRELDEGALKRKIAEMATGVPSLRHCVFNLHCPPHNTSLDLAPELTADLRPRMTAFGPAMAHVGSTAVREAIETLKPSVGLHGHIHDQHTSEKVGETLCFNPGSQYFLGTVQGVLLSYEDGELKAAHLTRERISPDDEVATTHGLAGLLKAIPFVGYALHELLFRQKEAKGVAELKGIVEEMAKKLEGIEQRIATDKPEPVDSPPPVP